MRKAPPANDVFLAVITPHRGGAYGGFFLWRELIVNEHSKL